MEVLLIPAQKFGISKVTVGLEAIAKEQLEMRNRKCLSSGTKAIFFEPVSLR